MAAQTVRARIINNDRRCDMFPGASGSDKVAACLADIPSGGGRADSSGILGATTWSSNPFAGVTKPIDFWCTASVITITVDITIPANVTIHPGTQCIFDGASTLTINGKIDNPHNSQMFTAALPLILNTTSDSPDWFGAKHDGVTDDHDAIQAAFDAFSNKLNPYSDMVGPSGGGWAKVRFSPGIYLYTTNFSISKSGIHLEGEGKSSTFLRFNPVSGPAVGCTFSASGAEELHYVGIENLTMDATGSDLSVVKTILKTVDLSDSTFQNFDIFDSSDTTHSSVGWEMHGRDTMTIDKVEIFANRALYIGDDPNASNEGLDATTFTHVLFVNALSLAEGLTILDDHPVVEVSQAEAFLTNVLFDTFDFIGGSHSFYWVATNTKTGSANHVSFKHGRNEQGSQLWGWYISNPYYVVGLNFDDVLIYQGSIGGIYARNISMGSINNYLYNLTGTAFDFDSTVHMIPTNYNANVHSTGVYNALNGWCGFRSNGDNPGSVQSDGVSFMRSCGTAQLVLESAPGGTTYNVTAGSCTGAQLQFTTSANVFAAGGRITVSGVTPSGLNGTYDVIAADPTHVTVINNSCPLTYSSGGTAAMTYGPLAYVSTNNTLSGLGAGDLALRSDSSTVGFGIGGFTTAAFTSSILQFMDSAGTTVKSYIGSKGNVLSDWTTDDLQFRSDGSKIMLGFSGISKFAFYPGWLQFYAASGGTTSKAQIGSAGSVMTNWTTDDLQIRSDSSAIRFGFNGTEAQYMPNPGGLVFDSGVTAPVGAAGTVGFGAGTQAAGAGNCPATITINGTPTAPTGCLVITVGGTGRSVPYF